MAQVIWVRMNWDNTAFPVRLPLGFYNMHVDPSTEHPFGEKGKVIAATWKQLTREHHTDGLCILDGDVAIDPVDVMNMTDAIHKHPEHVVVAPARIYPISTKRNQWTWAHWATEPSQVMETENVRWFSFNFTYLPRKVLDAAIRDGLRNWSYPGVDKRVSESAYKAGVPVFVATSVTPKHLNF